MTVRDLSAIFLDATDQPLPYAARGLASAGVPVFPVAPRDKVPLIRHGRGFRDATTDLRQVEAWWRRFPQANIGVPTGAASGLVVVDVDVHGTNGYDALHRADRAGLVMGWEFLVRTPTGGLHLYYPAADEMEQRSWQAGDAGIDFRGDGGYIVAPPSLRVIDGEMVPYRITELGTEPARPLDAGRLRGFLEPPRPPRRFPPRMRGQGRTDPQKLGLVGRRAHGPESEAGLGLVRARRGRRAVSGGAGRDAHGRAARLRVSGDHPHRHLRLQTHPRHPSSGR
ncbi:bifunctional DNA primase/polymerase [Spiractinospora alimapuensis]|uniref:bifunctional DNA primase/polymerase n=1 Tax=Spiractinospora alimapuensis TaxID=2820884 RepID=UPI001F1E9AB8|nr:bifunctional DNA primase/polymerase [Spiractinospora alimapuensis]QVQ51359.1 bifunctional DNA primase/polymerase [Spiractinospora alimapuensis]